MNRVEHWQDCSSLCEGQSCPQLSEDLYFSFNYLGCNVYGRRRYMLDTYFYGLGLRDTDVRMIPTVPESQKESVFPGVTVTYTFQLSFKKRTSV